MTRYPCFALDIHNGTVRVLDILNGTVRVLRLLTVIDKMSSVICWVLIYVTLFMLVV